MKVELQRGGSTLFLKRMKRNDYLHSFQKELDQLYEYIKMNVNYIVQNFKQDTG